MKKQDVTQNVIVKLDFNELNKIIREQDKNGELLGYQGLYEKWSYINDQIILHRFAYLKNTMEAVDLLGIILSNIDNCLSYIYFVGYRNKKYRCIGYYDGNGIEIDDIQSESGEDILEEDKTVINNYAYENEQEVLIECSKMSKYYKEYYTRLFDRGRTVK